jgi:hypothetical protein
VSQSSDSKDSTAAALPAGQVAKHRKGGSINPKALQDNRKPTTLKYTQTHGSKVVEMDLEVYDAVLIKELRDPEIDQHLAKEQNISYEPYFSSGDEEEDREEPTVEGYLNGKLVKKKASELYAHLPLPVAHYNTMYLPAAPKPKGTKLSNIEQILIVQMIQAGYQKANVYSLLGILPATLAHHWLAYSKYGIIEYLPQSTRLICLLSKGHMWAIHQWIIQDAQLALANTPFPAGF